MYFSDKASMHTKIETNKLALPVFLSRPSRNIYYDARVTFLRFVSVSVSILTLLTAKEAITISQQLFVSTKCNNSIYTYMYRK